GPLAYRAFRFGRRSLFLATVPTWAAAPSPTPAAPTHVSPFGLRGLECRSGPSDAGSDLPDLGDTVTRVATQASSAATGPKLRRWRSVRGAGGLGGFAAGGGVARGGGFLGEGV